SEQKFKEKIISEIEHLNVRSLSSQMTYDFETAKQELELAKLDLQKYLDLSIQDDLEVEVFYDIEALTSQAMESESESQPESETELEPQSDKDTKTAEEGPYPFEGAIQVPTLGELVDLAYGNRPELRIESAKLQVARLEERIRWGEMLPQVDVVLDFGKLGEAFDIDSTDPGLREEFRFMLELNWNVGISKLNYTFENNEQPPSVTQFLQGAGSQVTRNTFGVSLLDGLDKFTEAKEAEVEKLEQIAKLENAEKEVIQDVKKAYFDFQKARIQVKSTLQRVSYRERLVRLAEHRLARNEVEISEYLQAEIDLLRERGELHKALKDYLDAKAQLNRAVGIRKFLPIEEEQLYGK
ncbi:MAG: TolC family protein, partial [Candidatus Omnitrophica bacterium]|nr:TolC family protein [Candidatus Omnitrophota bacterium]